MAFFSVLAALFCAALAAAPVTLNIAQDCGCRGDNATSNTRALQAMADDLAAKPWCGGDFFTLADIAVGCCLGWLELRLPDLPWRRSHPNLARLADKLAQRPSFKDTVA